MIGVSCDILRFYEGLGLICFWWLENGYCDYFDEVWDLVDYICIV